MSWRRSGPTTRREAWKPLTIGCLFVAAGSVLRILLFDPPGRAIPYLLYFPTATLEARLDPVVRIDASGRITDVNEASVRATGVPRAQLVGTDFSPCFTETTRANEDYRQAFAQGTVLDHPLTTRNVDGRLTDVLYNASLYRDGDGQVLGFFAAARDITAIQRSQALTERLYAELEVFNRELEAFSYSVSHDLRTPLRSIDGFSRILVEDYTGALNAAGLDYLSRMRAAARRMATLIDDLLGLARVSRTTLRCECVDLSAMARTVAEELQAAQPERRVAFAAADRVTLNADARLPQVVLQNLPGSAWKLTTRRTDARVEFGSVTGHGGTAVFVRDDGAGFGPRYAGKRFGAFQPLHGSTRFPGRGERLATVQRIVRRDGGRVWAEGAVDQGATIWISSFENDASMSASILLVEDDPDNVPFTLRALKEHNLAKFHGRRAERPGGARLPVWRGPARRSRLARSPRGDLPRPEAARGRRARGAALPPRARADRDAACGHPDVLRGGAGRADGLPAWCQQLRAQAVDFDQFLDEARQLGLWWPLINETLPSASTHS